MTGGRIPRRMGRSWVSLSATWFDWIHIHGLRLPVSPHTVFQGFSLRVKKIRSLYYRHSLDAVSALQYSVWLCLAVKVYCFGLYLQTLLVVAIRRRWRFVACSFSTPLEACRIRRQICPFGEIGCRFERSSPLFCKRYGILYNFKIKTEVK